MVISVHWDFLLLYMQCFGLTPGTVFPASLALLWSYPSLGGLQCLGAEPVQETKEGVTLRSLQVSLQKK